MYFFVNDAFNDEGDPFIIINDNSKNMKYISVTFQDCSNGVISKIIQQRSNSFSWPFYSFILFYIIPFFIWTFLICSFVPCHLNCTNKIHDTLKIISLFIINNVTLFFVTFQVFKRSFCNSFLWWVKTKIWLDLFHKFITHHW